MRKDTKIHHPDLKTTVTVDERAVPIWEASGWKRGPRPDDTPPDEREPQTDERGPQTEEPPADPAPKAGHPAKPKTPAAPPATPDA